METEIIHSSVTIDVEAIILEMRCITEMQKFISISDQVAIAIKIANFSRAQC